MSSLAKMLLSSGYEVSGYDAVYGRQVQSLRNLGVEISVGGEEICGVARAEVVIYTDAIPSTDKRLVYARQENKLILSRGQLLSLLCNEFSRVISVAGSHGKTTCTAMCAHALSCTGTPFAAHIGGEDVRFDNFMMSGTEFLITEACEYKKNLSKITADSAILLNVDKDHLECYKDENELKNLFKEYLLRAKTAFVCIDDKNCRKILEEEQKISAVTFSAFDISADYIAWGIRRTKDGYTFNVTEYGKKLCCVQLRVPGRHNVLNALAAIAVLRSYGFDEKEIVKGLQGFSGVKRRFERLGNIFGAEAIADYAHHPREIEATVSTAMENGVKKNERGKIIVIFQPHTYSRTKLLMKEFIDVLQPLKNVVVYRTFSARESYDEQGSARRLAECVGAIYADNTHALETYLKATAKEGDLLLFLGAGDIYRVAQYLAR